MGGFKIVTSFRLNGYKLVNNNVIPLSQKRLSRMAESDAGNL